MNTKVSKYPLTIPKSLDEVDELIAEIGDVDQRLAKEKARTDRSIARVRQEAKERTKDILAKRSANVKRITKFAKKNRDAILPMDRKSLELSAGTIGWRFGPYKVNLSCCEQSLITWLETNKMPKYLRYSVELNRDQLIEDRPDFVPGVSFEQKEFFFIEPKSETAPATESKVVALVRVAK